MRQGSQDTAAPSQSGKEPKRAREDATPAAAFGEPSASTSATKKAKQEEDLVPRTPWRRGLLLHRQPWSSRMHVSSNNCGARGVREKVGS